MCSLEGAVGPSLAVIPSNMNSQTPKTEPDPDAIKMFVGQIPRSMDENDLRKMFEDFGPIYQLNVLRDKITGQSKGCCFITFYTRKSALDAQNKLHNIKTMPGMQHPIQMKPADSEKRNVEERKLFVGMLAKKCNENDCRMMFSPFGTIEECTVLREQNNQSKGCAFVTYASRQCAQNAIKAMHHSQTMEGCRSPLVVKFADTQKEKEMKKIQQMNTNLLSMANLSSLASLGPQYLAAEECKSLLAARHPLESCHSFNYLLQQAASAGNLGAFGNLQNLGAGDVNNLQNLQNLQGLAALASMANSPTGVNALGVQNLAALNQLAATANSVGMAGMNTTGTTGLQTTSGSVAVTNTTNSSVSGLGGMQGMQNSGALGGVAAAVTPTMTGNMNGIGNASMAGGQAGMDALTQAYSGIQQYAGLSGLLGQGHCSSDVPHKYTSSFPNAFTAQTAAQIQQAAANSPAGKQTEGPDGANLFIYHLPQEFGDQDLMQTFMPFGNVVSAKVFIDKQTNLSKCFGFVSYDNPLSAQQAIQAMNGFQIGMKRLKVQLKRPKNDSKPY